MSAEYDAEAARQRAIPWPPANGVLDLRTLVELGTLAPSSHNSQPWLFRLRDDAIEIAPDPTRRCPVVDPDDAHLFKSLGCAAETIVQAAAAAGHATEIAGAGRAGSCAPCRRSRASSARSANSRVGPQPSPRPWSRNPPPSPRSSASRSVPPARRSRWPTAAPNGAVRRLARRERGGAAAPDRDGLRNAAGGLSPAQR